MIEKATSACLQTTWNNGRTCDKNPVCALSSGNKSSSKRRTTHRKSSSYKKKSFGSEAYIRTRKIQKADSRKFDSQQVFSSAVIGERWTRDEPRTSIGIRHRRLCIVFSTWIPVLRGAYRTVRRFVIFSISSAFAIEQIKRNLCAANWEGGQTQF